MRRAARLALVLAAAALLAACGSAPKKSPAPAPAASSGGGKGGGYYQDDGPPERSPADLAAIPDAQPRVEAPHRFANRPYQALGQIYTPVTGDAPLKQRGHASWYGRQFHGNRTATGEIYDMFTMTAAHPTMELPSYARVTNLANGRSVIVRVNDRGPFLAGRVIDLSYAAATRLGYVGAGTAQVEVERITMAQIARGDWPRGSGPAPALAAAAPIAPPEPLPAPAPAAPPATQVAAAAPVVPLIQAAPAAPTGRWAVQLGVFSVAANAQALAAHAGVLLGMNADLPDHQRAPRIERDGALYRVLVGSLPDRAAAREAAARLAELLAREAVPVAR